MARCIFTLQDSTHVMLKKLAADDERSISKYLDRLIRETARLNGLTQDGHKPAPAPQAVGSNDEDYDRIIAECGGIRGEDSDANA